MRSRPIRGGRGGLSSQENSLLPFNHQTTTGGLSSTNLNLGDSFRRKKPAEQQSVFRTTYPAFTQLPLPTRIGIQPTCASNTSVTLHPFHRPISTPAYAIMSHTCCETHRRAYVPAIHRPPAHLGKESRIHRDHTNMSRRRRKGPGLGVCGYLLRRQEQQRRADCNDQFYVAVVCLRGGSFGSARYTATSAPSPARACE